MEAKIKFIMEYIRELNKDEYIEIFNIINNNNIPYSQNSNGIFVKLIVDNDSNSKINNNVHFTDEEKNEKISNKKIIQEVFYYINFCIKNNKLLELREHKLDSEKKNLNYNFKSINKNPIETNDEPIDKKKDYKMIGDKIVLKKIKIKYSSAKNKIIKNYKDMSQQLIVQHYSSKLTKKKKTIKIEQTLDMEYSEDEAIIEDDIEDDIELDYSQ